MSGSPTEAEVQTQWKNAVQILESTRDFFDSTLVTGGKYFDVLIQSLEGDYTPAGLTSAVARIRAAASSMIDSGRAQEFLTPILYEYAKLFSKGSGFSSAREILRALYEHFHANTLSVKTRAITYDTSATAGGSNVGNGAFSRLTVDERGYNLEACHVEKKVFRCIQDRNTGAQEHGEVFEFVGTAASQDALARSSFGSGERTRVRLRSMHAGNGPGGSLLRNSSFDSYSASATPKFTGWTETAGGAALTQDTTNYYRSNPGASVNGALKITWGGSTVTITQAIDAMRISRLDENQPYFCRLMVNKTVGSGSGGNLVLRFGSVTVTTALASIGSNWQEIIVPLTSSCWPRTFNQNPFRIQIEWASGSSGYLLIDDVIFAPFDEVDGTFWALRQNAGTPVSWMLDDTLEFTDTGGAPADAKIQWWLWVAGYGYLPSHASPTLADPA